MTTIGAVREWHDDEGWGVIDSAETPGGCWAHVSAVAVTGYRALAAGQAVRLDWESPGQDGWPFRAVRVWPDGTDPAPASAETGSAYSSVLTLEFDPD
jgi:cold shock protein